MFDQNQQRDTHEERYNERLMRDYSELGYEDAASGISRAQAKRWCSVSLTVEQERDYWQGYQSASS
jgi:hypothetical protein